MKPAHSPATAAKPYVELIDRVREANLLESSASVLGWDQETMMPAGGLEHRSRQLAQMARLVHQMKTDPRLGELLAACEAEPSIKAEPLSSEAVNVREIRREYDRATKLPTSLVEELTKISSVARAEWAKARKASDFKLFKPWLERIVKLLREKAACFGWPKGGEAWDALAEDYEPGCTAAQVEAVFKPLRTRLVNLVSRLMASPRKPTNAFNEVKLPISQQEKFVRFVAQRIGFDFNRGRLDVSTHPFCSGSHCNDVRMTTRFHEDNVNDALGSTMHESGHGIYEQNLPADAIGTPIGSAVSLGIHESQSRLWENQVGRSEGFWKWLHPQLADYFGDAAGGLSMRDVYRSVNIVQPSLIRVEADEATYNLHIMVRFEIERALMSGAMSVEEVPAVWNTRYKEYLDIDVPDDRRGCLQDIHWSMASMGYFPTYTLGNLYAAQFFERALSDIGDLSAQIEHGEFSALRQWLTAKIHSQGMRFGAARLCEVVTGEPLSADPLLRHLESKLLPVYEVA
ncbi:MAG: carboxypeptidase M32 [Phycisphaeraceae bacterium]